MSLRFSMKNDPFQILNSKQFNIVCWMRTILSRILNWKDPNSNYKSKTFYLTQILSEISPDLDSVWKFFYTLNSEWEWETSYLVLWMKNVEPWILNEERPISNSGCKIFELKSLMKKRFIFYMVWWMKIIFNLRSNVSSVHFCVPRCPPPVIFCNDDIVINTTRKQWLYHYFI